jgi:hypothetical protein
MKREGLKKRNFSTLEDAKPLYDELTNDLPYKGKVFLARKKKPDSWLMIIFQVKATTNKLNTK